VTRARAGKAPQHRPAARRAVRGGAGDGVALAWARDRDGKLVPARALDAATRRSRAPFTCPGCGEELVARLGTQRARHFAHRPGAACPLTAPETALHFNAKTRLLALCGEAFGGVRRVVLLTRCPACRRPDPRDLGALGDAAAAEGAVGLFRADVLVSRAGAPALAVEVLVTHAVDSAKEAALTGSGVPAVEVDARDEWERSTPEGGVEVVCHRSLGFSPCLACRIAGRAEADRALGGEAAEVAELESYRARGLLGRLDAPSNYSRSGADYSRSGAPNEARPDAPFSGSERAGLSRRFRCPECQGGSLRWGTRLVRHACLGQPPRPVAWRGYDGRLTELAWWKR